MDGIQLALENLKKAKLALEKSCLVTSGDLDSDEDWAEFVAARSVVESIIGAFLWEQANMCVRVNISNVIIPDGALGVE